MPWDYVELLTEMIRIPSVNPMGNQPLVPPFGEQRMGDFLEERFRELHLEVERQSTEPGRDNILARLDGSVPLHDGGKCLLIDVHQDTVGTAGMTIDPFEPQIEQGRVYGRGACDVKGSVAVVLGVLSRLVESPPAEMPTLVVACTVNEENGFSGAKRLVESWTAGRSRLLAQPPDAAVVAEPTELNVVVCHKGVIRWRCHTAGKAAHSSQPQAGDNAIYRMARVVTTLKQYAEQLGQEDNRHPLLSPATLGVGTITGGISVNTVPDRCSIEIDRRLLPDEDPRAAFSAVQQHLAENLPPGDAAEHDPPFLSAGGLSDQNNAALAQSLQNVVRGQGVACRQVGVPYGTDASAISATGIPSVVFGPGSIEQAHTADEWIDIEQMNRASAILLEFCSGRPF